MLLLAAAACGSTQLNTTLGEFAQPPEINRTHVLTADGYRLPLHRWPARESPAAIVLGLHGFNDHGGGFDALSKALNRKLITVYAYDQRGFGQTADAGIWPGKEALRADATAVAALLRARYPQLPLYLVGKSMGGAVTLLTLAHPDAPNVDGSVLIAPAVFSDEVMPWYRQAGLSVARQLLPGLKLSVGLAESLGFTASDDETHVRRLRTDPMVRNRTRVDTLYHLVGLMRDALDAAEDVQQPLLILHGQRDQIIPAHAICTLLQRLPDGGKRDVVLYRDGHHMLTRYSAASRTHADVGAWVLAPARPPPSARSAAPGNARDELC